MLQLQTRDILARLKTKLGLKSDNDLALQMGVNIGRIHNWKNRNTIPVEEILTICDKENIDLHEIFTGNIYQKSATQSEEPESDHLLATDPDETRAISKPCFCGQPRVCPPLGKYRLTSNDGNVIEEFSSPQIVDVLSPSLNWLNHQVGIDLTHVLLVRNIGDNMAPWLQDGDLVWVDTSLKSTINGGCMLLRYADGMMMVRRVFRNSDGTFLAKCDSDCCEPDILDPQNNTKFPIIVGRIIRRVVR